MFWLMEEHHVLPGDYYRMPEGEKEIIRRFFEKSMGIRRDRLK